MVGVPRNKLIVIVITIVVVVVCFGGKRSIKFIIKIHLIGAPFGNYDDDSTNNQLQHQKTLKNKNDNY